MEESSRLGVSRLSYSLLNDLSVLSTGWGAVCPNPQRLIVLIVLPSSSSLARSAACPRPSRIFSTSSCISRVPTRQGVQYPQLSSMKKKELWALWKQLFKQTAPPQIRRELLIRILAFRIQEDIHGK